MVRFPFVTLFLLAVATLFLVPQAQGDVIDPATIHVGPGGTTGCATGGCYVFGNEVNGISDGTIDLFQTSKGANNLVSPVLLIFAVPNDTSTNDPLGAMLGASNVSSTAELDNSSGIPVPPPVTVAFGVDYPAAGDAFGPTAGGLTGGTSGFQGYMGSGTDVYTFLGIGSSENNSESFTNFQMADAAAAGVTVGNSSDYGIYVYSIDTSLFGGKNFLQLDITGIPQGTFIMGYGQDAYAQEACLHRDRHGNCTKFGFSDYTLYGTPFTEAGLTTQAPPHHAPEPAGLLLLGSGLLGLGTLLRRKLRD